MYMKNAKDTVTITLITVYLQSECIERIKSSYICANYNRELDFGVILGEVVLCRELKRICRNLLKSRLRIEVRPTENDLTQLYKNGEISVVITCS